MNFTILDQLNGAELKFNKSVNLHSKNNTYSLRIWMYDYATTQ